MNALIINRKFKLTLLVIAAVVLQCTLLNFVKIHNVSPNLLVIILVCFSLHEKYMLSSAVFGVICGVMIDILGNGLFGVNALLCMYAAIASTAVSSRFFKGKAIVSLLFVCFFSLCYELAYYVLCVGLWNTGNLLYSIIHVIIPTTAYNTVIAIPLFFLMRRFKLVANKQ